MNKKGRIALILVFVLMVSFLAVNVSAGWKWWKPRACSDRVDNDGDGLIDYPADPGCRNIWDRDEYNAPVYVCGDGTCNGDETCETCEVDCGVCPPICGDLVCEDPETCLTCEEDCGICDSCSDTDYGFNVYLFGEVSGYSSGSPYLFSDYCSDSVTLFEYYCSGSQWQVDTFECTGNYTGCMNGTCY
jgi:hypothetical protein